MSLHPLVIELCCFLIPFSNSGGDSVHAHDAMDQGWFKCSREEFNEGGILSDRTAYSSSPKVGDVLFDGSLLGKGL